MGKIKILSLERYGYISVDILEENRYRYQRKQLALDLNKEMPNHHEIPWSNKQSWRMLNKDLMVKIKTDKEEHIINLNSGMITDFASVPRMFRAQRSWKTFFIRMPDNDDPRILWPSLIHDAGCSFKLFGNDKAGFKFNNDLFYATCRYFGLSRAQCRLLWAGVSSPIGWDLYQSGRGYEEYIRAQLASGDKNED